MSSRLAEYLPRQWGGDPIRCLAAADELIAELTDAIHARLERGERHTHPAKGSCDVCAHEAAETAVRYLEANTRVIKSEALAPEEFERARKAMLAVPHLISGFSLRLTGKLAADPDFPTVDDLLADLEAIAEAAVKIKEQDRERERELRTYRKWHEEVRSIAEDIVEQVNAIDAAEDR